MWHGLCQQTEGPIHSLSGGAKWIPAKRKWSSLLFFSFGFGIILPQYEKFQCFTITIWFVCRKNRLNSKGFQRSRWRSGYKGVLRPFSFFFFLPRSGSPGQGWRWSTLSDFAQLPQEQQKPLNNFLSHTEGTGTLQDRQVLEFPLPDWRERSFMSATGQKKPSWQQNVQLFANHTFTPGRNYSQTQHNCHYYYYYFCFHSTLVCQCLGTACQKTSFWWFLKRIKCNLSQMEHKVRYVLPNVNVVDFGWHATYVPALPHGCFFL